MSHTRPVPLSLLLVLSVGLPASSPFSDTGNGSAVIGAKAARTEAFGDMPLHFEPSTDGDPRHFVSQGTAYGVAFTATSASFRLSGAPPATVRLDFVGARPEAAVEAVDRLPGRSNYLMGDDARGWQLGVPHFARVRYPAMYPGIDAVFYADQRRLEFDFVVAPGADPAQIGLAIEGGADQLRVDRRGDLVIETPAGRLVQRAPRLHQDVGGRRRAVQGGYQLGGSHVRFRVGAYDHSQPLVIDPVLAYSTYLGGKDEDWASALAADSAGYAYVAGSTTSSDFPIRNGLPGRHGVNVAYVAKFDPAGNLLYSTYLGGTGIEDARGIATDGSGNAYVTGLTGSSDFPVRNAFQADQGADDAFVTKLDPSGAIVYSTYVGGSASEYVEGIGVDGSGQAYIAGYTYSTDFPTKNPVQATNAGGFGDVFVTKLDASGSALVYSTYLGGSDHDWGYDIGVNAAGTAYVTGATRSTDYPTKNAQQPTINGVGDVFVSSFDPAGGLRWSTYLGGSGNEYGWGVAADMAGNAYVTGETGPPTSPH